eukprot:1185902-Prorocentrum_minimum.AAC.2
MKRVGTLRSYRLVLGEQRHPDLQCLRAIVDVPIRYERESSAHSFLGKGLLKNAGQPRWKVVTPRRNIVVCAKKKQVSKKASGANVSGIGFGEKRTQVNGGQKRLKQKCRVRGLRLRNALSADTFAQMTQARHRMLARQETTRQRLKYVFQGNIERARAMIEDGADINLMDPTNGTTLLALSAEMNNSEMLRFLIENGANISLGSVTRTGASDPRVTCFRPTLTSLTILVRA